MIKGFAQNSLSKRFIVMQIGSVLKIKYNYYLLSLKILYSINSHVLKKIINFYNLIFKINV